MKDEFKHWRDEKKLIPVMILKYCKGNHKAKRKEEGVSKKCLCSECTKLNEYALFRLEKCPFKKNKGFCSFCKIHCYIPEYKTKIKDVMRYAGPRMLLSHPIFSISHVVQMIKYKKKMKKEQKNDR